MRDECFHFVLVCQTTCTELWVTSSYILVPMKGFAIQFRLLGEPLIENLFSMLMTRARLLKFKFAKQIYVETLGRKMRTWKRLPFSLWSGSNDLDSVPIWVRFGASGYFHLARKDVWIILSCGRFKGFRIHFEVLYYVTATLCFSNTITSVSKAILIMKKSFCTIFF